MEPSGALTVEPKSSEPAIPLAIQQIALREIRLPLREPFVTAAGSIRDRRLLLLEVLDGEGFSAWSECVALETPGYLPETLDTAWLALREWAGTARSRARF